MKILDRYIFLSLLKIMLSTILVGVLILTMARLLIIMKLKAIDDQDFSVIFRMLAYFMPNYLGFMLPFALFWACFMVVRRLSSGSELRVFSAAGVSYRRIIVPFLSLAVLTLLVNFMVYGWFEPLARYNYRFMVRQIENAAAYIAIPPGVFMRIGDRTVYIDSVDRSNRSFKGLFLLEETNNGYANEFIAARGSLIMQDDVALLRLEDGNRMRLPSNPENPMIYGAPQDNLQFINLDMPLDVQEPGYYKRGHDEEEYTVSELIGLMSTTHPAISLNRVSVQLNHKLIVICTALVLPFLAFAMAHSGPRGVHYLKAPLAFMIVIAFQQFIDFCKVFSWENHLPPYAALWPAFILLTLVSIGTFMSLEADPLNPFLLKWKALTRRLRHFLDEKWRWPPLGPAST